MAVAVPLEKNLAALETSGGIWEACTRTKEELGWRPVLLPEARTGIATVDQEAYFLPGANAIKDKTKATVILVGGFRSFSKIEEILNRKAADFVALCRPLIRQPDLPNLWRSGEQGGTVTNVPLPERVGRPLSLSVFRCYCIEGH